jgi:hypothetical protein
VPTKRKPALRKVSLESVFRPKCQLVHGVPLVIFDFRVHVHAILQRVLEFAERAGIDLPLTEPDADGKQWPDTDLLVLHDLWPGWVRASWSIRLNRGPDMLPRCTYRVIVVDDSKLQLDDGRSVYWRGLVYQEYKAGRSAEALRDNCYKSIRDIGHALVAELGLPFYSKTLYEADDWAGLCYRLKLSAEKDSLLWRREMLLSTVDSDWLQLVNDEAGILWANTGPWQSRLKNEAETRAYVHKRMGLRIAKPSEIASVKQRQGDTADNLPAGSDLSLFDLCGANPDYYLDDMPDAARLLADMSSPDSNTEHRHLHKSVQWCNSHGLPIVCKP